MQERNPTTTTSTGPKKPSCILALSCHPNLWAGHPNIIFVTNVFDALSLLPLSVSCLAFLGCCGEVDIWWFALGCFEGIGDGGYVMVGRLRG